MELADNALVTVEMARSMLGLSAEDEVDDDIIVLLINGISSWIERYLGYGLKQSDHDETYEPSGTQKQMLRNRPVTDVYGVHFNGAEIPKHKYIWNDVALGEYGILFKDDGWPWMDYIAGIAYESVARSRNLRVKYQAGYVLPKDATADNPSTLPGDILMLFAQMLSSLYTSEFSGAAGLSAYSISDISWTFDKETTKKIAAGLRPYR